MVTKSRVNGAVAIMKFVYVNMIVVIHSGMPWGEGRLLSGSYIFCDFMFMVMGFYGGFITSTDENSAVDKAGQYLKKRLHKWLPFVIVETVLLFSIRAVIVLRSGGTIYDCLSMCLGAVYDISFLRILVRSAPGLNGTLWFLQAALWAGALLILVGGVSKRLNSSILFWGGGILCNI